MNKIIFIFALLNILLCFTINYPVEAAFPERIKNEAQESFFEFENNQKSDHPLRRVKRRFEDRYWTTKQIIEAILCVFLPPAAVLIHGGPDMVLHLILNIVLWVCGWVPGAIHAFWYCFYRY